MSLREQIQADMKSAMKEKDMDRLNALRLVQSAFKNREIELRPNPMAEDEYQLVLKKLVKQRKESIEQFGAAGRQDLVDNETKELKLLETYLPAQMDRAQIEKIVAEAIAATGASSVKQMGLVMKEAQARAGGAADNKLLSDIIKSKLA